MGRGDSIKGCRRGEMNPHAVQNLIEAARNSRRKGGEAKMLRGGTTETLTVCQSGKKNSGGKRRGEKRLWR